MRESSLKAGREIISTGTDVLFAFGIVCILIILFLPLPPILIDLGLAISIALSVLILMVALWIQKPLEFSSFPTILLIATMLRLALNVATTRLILSNGAEGYDAAGYVISGFSNFLMAGDFVIGVIVFIILVVVNFLVITKGAGRIAEVGARFTLDAIPGKQMAIDADLSAGLINEAEAQRRRRELQEESNFFGSMDGASKFVRGDAIAGLVITAVNILGGIIIGVTRNGMSIGDAADVFTRLSVGDGLVTQIPALIISLAAGLLVSKGSSSGRTEEVVAGQLGHYPRALLVVAVLMAGFALMPGLPVLPFIIIGAGLGWLAFALPRQRARADAEVEARETEAKAVQSAATLVKDSIRHPEIEVRLGRHLSNSFMPRHEDLSHRVSKMRRKFAQKYGFVVPEIKLTDDLELGPKTYDIRIHGASASRKQLEIGQVLVVCGDGPMPNVPGDEVLEPAFGINAMWVPAAFSEELRREGFTPIDPASVLLTHLSEVIRNNLAQLLSYRDMQILIRGLEPEYQRLLDEISPAHISQSGLQAVLKCLLAERVSIANLQLILEAVAEIAPHVRRAEQIAEHVRVRLANQICADIAVDGVLSVLRLGPRWEATFHQATRRGEFGEVLEFDIDPAVLEQFTTQSSSVIRRHMDEGGEFALVVSPEARPYVRMIVERAFATLAVLSHLELARGVNIKTIGTID